MLILVSHDAALAVGSGPWRGVTDREFRLVPIAAITQSRSSLGSLPSTGIGRRIGSSIAQLHPAGALGAGDVEVLRQTFYQAARSRNLNTAPSSFRGRISSRRAGLLLGTAVHDVNFLGARTLPWRAASAAAPLPPPTAATFLAAMIWSELSAFSPYLSID